MFPANLKGDLTKPNGRYLQFSDDEMEMPPDANKNPPTLTVNLSHCVFSNIRMKFVRFRQGGITHTRFRECYLPHARFERVDLTGTEFIDCNLREASFDCSNLDYVVFRNCDLDYDSILLNLPKRANLRWRLLRLLRLNASAEGDMPRSNQLLLQELAASRMHERAKFMADSDYYRKRYNFRDRLSAFAAWYGHYVQLLVWGYGLKPYRLLTNGLLVILAVAILTWLSQTTIYVPRGPSPRGLGFGEALYTSIVTFTTLGYGDFTPAEVFGRVIYAMESLFGALFIGLLAATAYRRIAR
jgi:hypothetical protein